MKYCKTLASLCLLAAMAWTKPAAAAESFHTCTGTITALPAVITTAGTWCLANDLATAITTGNAITVNTNNVTINCNDFRIGGLAAGLGTTAVGINADTRTNTTVRNCNIRGFFYGASLEGDGALAENNRFDSNTWVSLGIGGESSTARGNRILNTGGSTYVFNNKVKGVGIYSIGNVEIYDNVVNGVRARTGTDGFAFGINPVNNETGSVYRNQVKKVIADGIGIADGISFFGTTGRVTVYQNNIIGAGAGVTGSFGGIYCPEVNKVVLTDNVVNGFTFLHANCAYPEENTHHSP